MFVEWHKHKGMVRFYQKHFRQQYPAGLMGLVVIGVWLRFAAVATLLQCKQLRERARWWAAAPRSGRARSLAADFSQVRIDAAVMNVSSARQITS